MRLLRLELADVAGLSRAEVEFPEHGASVLPAPNERGKSTLVHALNALLTMKASADRAETRALRPVGRDVASVISAELLLGGERLRLTKHFNQSGRGRGRTELELLDEGRQLTGDEAHEEFRARFERLVDPTLHELLLFHQERALVAVAAGDSDLVRERLAEEVAAEGADDTFLAAAEHLAGSFWDVRAKGLRPKGELKGVADAVAALVARRDELAVAVARGADLGHRLERIAAEDAELAERRTRLDGLEVSRRAGEQAHLERERAAIAIERAAQRERLTADVAAAEAALEHAAAEVEAGATALADATTALADAEAALASAESAHDAASARESAVRAARARTLAAERDAAAARVAANPADAALVASASELEVALARDEAMLAGSAWRLTGTAARALRIVVDGEEIELAAGERVERDVVATFQHAGDDWQDLALVAEERTARLAEDAAERRRALAALLGSAGVADVAALRALAAEREAAVAAHATAATALAALVGDEDLEALLAAAAGSDTADTTDATDATAGPSAAELARAVDAARRTRDAALAELDRLTTEGARSTERRAAAAAAHGSAASALAAERAATPDDELERLATEARAVLDRLAPAPGTSAGAGGSTGGSDPAGANGPDADLDVDLDVDAERQRIEGRRRELVEERVRIEGERQNVARAAGELEDLEEELTPATEDLERRMREAHAATRLAGRLRAARDAQADRYQVPLQTRIGAHLSALLGVAARVELDETLAVVRRSRDGEGWIDWPALSAGAREQLTILTGLAMAELAGDQGVPFLLDDAIVHTDTERAGRLAELLAGTSAQVIVLTCREDLLGPLPRARHELVPAGALAADPSGDPEDER